MRSPEPNGRGGQAPGMPQGGNQNHSYYGHYLTGQVPQTYYAPALPPQDYAGQHHANPYYQTHPQVQVRTSEFLLNREYPRPRGRYDLDGVYEDLELITSLQTGQHPGYGPVTYYNAPAPQATYDYETRKRGYDALDAFFGQVKRREFDPMQYQAVSRRLFELQGLQLPQIIPSSLGVPAYQPVSVGGGGSYESNDPIQAYSLPPMGNAKTRGDLTSIDQILEQMQATIYENDTHQTGYVNYRTSSNSPPTAQMASAASHSPSALLQHQHQSSVASTADSASTPGLTPPSSAQSYTSGQSPVQGHSAPSGNGMYPSLPSGGDMSYAGGNAATLGGMYDDDQRRYRGGMLQRAAPAKKDADDMETATDGSVTPPAAAMNKIAKGKAVDSKDPLIDPALSGDAGTPRSDAGKEEDRETTWVQNMRLIEWMRDLIKKRLERGEYDEDDSKNKDPADTEMSGTDEKSATSDQEQLYPVLRHVEEAA
jgi:hypothetical protein